MMARRAAERVFGLENRIRDELPCVLIFQTVEHAGPVVAGGDDSGKAQLRQMLGNGGRGLSDDAGKVVYRQFPVSQRQDDPNAGGIREHGEHLNRKLDILAVRVETAYLLICIHT